MQLTVGSRGRPDDAQLAAGDLDEGVGAPSLGEPIGVVGGEQRDVATVEQRQVGRHELDRGLGHEHDE